MNQIFAKIESFDFFETKFAEKHNCVLKKVNTTIKLCMFQLV